MAVEYVSAGTVSAGLANTYTPKLPVNWSAGQLCLVFGYTPTAAGTWTVSSGWTKSVVSTSNATHGSMCVAYKVLAAGATPATLAYSATADSYVTRTITVNGVNPVTPLDITATGATFTCPGNPYRVTVSAINTVTDGALAIFAYGLHNDVVSIISNFTERTDDATAVGSDCALAIATKAVASAGSTNAATVTYASQGSGEKGYIGKLAIRPTVNTSLTRYDSDHLHYVDAVELDQQHFTYGSECYNSLISDKVTLEVPTSDTELVVSDTYHSHYVDDFFIPPLLNFFTDWRNGDPTDTLKLAFLTDSYTFDASDTDWSDVSSYEIDPTGNYATGGTTVDSSYNITTNVLSVTDKTIEFVTASVKHYVLKDSNDKLLCCWSYGSEQNFNYYEITFDFPASGIEFQPLRNLNSSDHLHYSDKATLVRNIILSISDSNHLQYVDGAELDQIHNLSVNNTYHSLLSTGNKENDSWMAKDGWISIQDIWIDKLYNLKLTQQHNLTVNDSNHLQYVDGISLTEHKLLTISDCYHLLSSLEANNWISDDNWMSIQNIWIDIQHNIKLIENAITNHFNLTVNDSNHLQYVDSLSLSQLHNLTVNDSNHLQYVDSLSLSQLHNLIIGDSNHLHYVDSSTLTQLHNLTVNDSSHLQYADEPTIQSQNTLSVSDSSHLQYADEPTVLGISNIQIFNEWGNIGNLDTDTVKLVLLNSSYTFDASDTDWSDISIYEVSETGNYTTGGVDLTTTSFDDLTNTLILVNESVDLISSTTVKHLVLLVENGSLLCCWTYESEQEFSNYELVLDFPDGGIVFPAIRDISDSNHLQYVDGISLSQIHNLTISDSNHLQYVDSLSISQQHNLTTNDSNHLQYVDRPTIQSQNTLSVSDSNHLHYSDEPTILGISRTQFFNEWGNIGNLDTDTVKLVLLNSSYTFDASDLTYNDISTYEIDPTGNYTTGGVNLTTTSFDDLTNTLILVNESVDLISSTTIKHLVLLVEDGSLLCCWTYESEQEFSNYELVLDFPDSGIVFPAIRDISDSNHLQYSDSISITEHKTVLISGSIHYQYSDKVSIIQQHNLTKYDADHLHYVDSVSLTEQQLLSISDSYHLLSSIEANNWIGNSNWVSIQDIWIDIPSNIKLIENVIENHFNLTINDSNHLHYVDGISLSQLHNLTINDSNHLQYVDSLTLSQLHNLTIGDSNHLQYVDGISLTEQQLLTISDCYHSLSSIEANNWISNDNWISNQNVWIDILYNIELIENVITNHFNLTINDSNHQHNVDGISLSQLHNLTVNDSNHLYYVDSSTLSQLHNLAVDGSDHLQLCDSIDLFGAGYLSVTDTYHSQYVDQLSLSQLHNLSVNDSTNSHYVDSISLTQHKTLVSSDSTHLHYSDSVTTDVYSYLTVADSYHNNIADQLSLSQKHNIVSIDSYHDQLSDNVTSVYNINVSVADTYHNQISDNITIARTFVLANADTYHTTESDKYSLTEHLILINNSSYHSHFADNVLTMRDQMNSNDSYHGLISDKVNIIKPTTFRIVEVLSEDRIVEVEADTTDRVANVISQNRIVRAA